MKKEGKPRGKNPPSRYNVIKRKEGEKTVAKKLRPSLQDDHAESETSSE